LFSLYKRLIKRASERARSFDKSKLEKKSYREEQLLPLPLLLQQGNHSAARNKEHGRSSTVSTSSQQVTAELWGGSSEKLAFFFIKFLFLKEIF
jgi:hypothetical protein